MNNDEWRLIKRKQVVPAAPIRKKALARSRSTTGAGRRGPSPDVKPPALTFKPIDVPPPPPSPEADCEPPPPPPATEPPLVMAEEVEAATTAGHVVEEERDEDSPSSSTSSSSDEDREGQPLVTCHRCGRQWDGNAQCVPCIESSDEE